MQEKVYVEQEVFELYFVLCLFRYSDATLKKYNWAYHIFRDWRIARNCHTVSEISLVAIEKNLVEMSVRDMNFALLRFIFEIRKKNGDDYPAETLYETVVCLQLYLATKGVTVEILDEREFCQVRNALDNRMKQLTKMGCVKLRKKARIITVDEENMMWNASILCSSNRKQLVETLLYLFGIHFSLRAGIEHKALRVGPNSQLKLVQPSDGSLSYLEYTEDYSQEFSGWH